MSTLFCHSAELILCFSVRQLPLAHQLSCKQNFWIPVSSTDHLLCNLPSKMNVRTAMYLTLGSSFLIENVVLFAINFAGCQCQLLS
ncbi:MAG: hypothetical protein ACR5LA_10030 [Wolbachia sp.]